MDFKRLLNALCEELLCLGSCGTVKVKDILHTRDIASIRKCHDRIGDRIWKREITVTEVKNVNESRSQGNGMKKG
jgi:hypothetical protein